MTTRKETAVAGDQLVPDAQVLREFGISSMSLHRWDHDPDLGFPPPVYIRKRKFRHRSLLENFKARLLEDAIEHRRSERKVAATA